MVVDGNLDTNMFSDKTDTAAWWKVDLGYKHQLTHMFIYNTRGMIK